MKTIHSILHTALLCIVAYLSFGIGVDVGLGQGQTMVIIAPETVKPTIAPPEENPLRNMSLTSKEAECMALNIYFEARDQSLDGKLAVGHVTLNRVKSSRYPNDICGVVWQNTRSAKTGKRVGQFSWTLDGKSDKPKEQPAWEESKLIAGTILDQDDPTDGATHYHANYVSPQWASRLAMTTVIGSHLFYR